MNEKKIRGAWKPGQSGNPKGKPPGTGKLQKLRAAPAGDVPEILHKLGEAAKGGDVQAARLILERVLPPMKATEQAQPMAILAEGMLTDKGRAVLDAVAAGELAPGQGAQLLAGIRGAGQAGRVDGRARPS